MFSLDLGESTFLTLAMPRPFVLALFWGVVFCASVPAHAEPAAIPIAVSDFANTSKDQSLSSLEKGLADMFISDLAVSDELVVVDREHLNDVLAEIELQKNPYFDKKGAARLGRGVGAEFIVTGSYLRQQGSLRIDVRVVDVQQGTVVYTTHRTGKDGALFELQAQVARVVLSELGAKLSLLQDKRLGRGGPRSIAALESYSKALTARDNGDAAAERRWLEEALRKDPSFARSQARLTKLESRVESIAQSGGLIAKPASAADYLFNYRIHRDRGVLPSAVESLQEALVLDPMLLDSWLSWAREGQSLVPSRVKLSAAQRKLALAFLRKETATLAKSLKGTEGRLAAAFVIALASEDLPASSLAPYLRVREALDLMAKGKVLGPHYLSEEEHAQLRSSLEKTHFLGRASGEVGVASFSSGTNRLFMGSWTVALSLDESPVATVKVRLSRSSRASWRETPALPPYPIDREPPSARARSSAGGYYDENDKARAMKDGYIWQVPRLDSFSAEKLLPAKSQRLGQWMKIPASVFDCRRNENSLSSKRCFLQLDFWDHFLPPGSYDIEVRYTSKDGRPVEERSMIWFRELHLHPSALGEFSGDYSMYQDIDALKDKEGQALRKTIVASQLHRSFKIHGIVQMNSYWRAHQETIPDPKFDRLKFVYFDIDYSLNGGVGPEGEQAELLYRDAIQRKGYKLRGAARGDQFIPLPKLSKGSHVVCLMATMTNGARSPIAHCQDLEVPSR